jgi:hypothetical protein
MHELEITDTSLGILLTIAADRYSPSISLASFAQARHGRRLRLVRNTSSSVSLIVEHVDFVEEERAAACFLIAWLLSRDLKYMVIGSDEWERTLRGSACASLHLASSTEIVARIDRFEGQELNIPVRSSSP